MASRRGLFYTLIIRVGFICFFQNCQSTTFEFSSSDAEQNIEMSLLDYTTEPVDENLVGTLPQTFKTSGKSGQVIKFKNQGYKDQYWLVADGMGSDQVVIKVELEKKDTADLKKNEIDENSIVKATNRNSYGRALMKAYQALAEKQYDLAISLANKAIEIDKEVAAPHIIIGLAHLSEGNSQQAKTSFGQAQFLDPEDPSIDELLEQVK